MMGVSAKGQVMEHPFTPLESLSFYEREQALFAKMHADLQNCKRRRRRRRALMWVLRRL